MVVEGAGVFYGGLGVVVGVGGPRWAAHTR